MKTIRLKDDNGNVMEVNEESCYPPDEKGYIMVLIDKFSYWFGKPTDEPLTAMHYYYNKK